VGPFHLLADIGVTVWFDLFGHHELGVDLKVWTPQFGGTAHISILCFSADIPFGADQHDPNPLTVPEFLNNHLRLPSAPGPQPPDHAMPVAAFSSPEWAGLWRVDVGFGRLPKNPQSQTTPPQSQNDAQEGTSQDSPISVNAEFGLVIRTRLPVFDPVTLSPQGSACTISGGVNLPLCNDSCDNLWKVVAPPPSDPNNLPTFSTCGRMYPAAQFGPQVRELQQKNGVEGFGRQAGIAAIQSKPSTVYGEDTITFDYSATPVPSIEQATSIWEIELRINVEKGR
jgi:hypothetical protein